MTLMMISSKDGNLERCSVDLLPFSFCSLFRWLEIWVVLDISVWFQSLLSFTLESYYSSNSLSMRNMLRNIGISTRLSMLGSTGISSLALQSLSLPTLVRYNCSLFILNWLTRTRRELRKSSQDQSWLTYFSMFWLLLQAISLLTARPLRLFSTEALLLVAETMLLWLLSFPSSWFCLLQYLSITTLSETRFSTCSSKRNHSLRRSNYQKPLLTLYRNIICTFSFIAFTCFLAIVYPNVSDVLGILGGLNATAIQFLVPSKYITN